MDGGVLGCPGRALAKKHLAKLVVFQGQHISGLESCGCLGKTWADMHGLLNIYEYSIVYNSKRSYVAIAADEGNIWTVSLCGLSLSILVAYDCLWWPISPIKKIVCFTHGKPQELSRIRVGMYAG